jgi:hypothetical protein
MNFSASLTSLSRFPGQPLATLQVDARSSLESATEERNVEGVDMKTKGLLVGIAVALGGLLAFSLELTAPQPLAAIGHSSPSSRERSMTIQSSSRRTRARGPLRVHPTNPRYFTDGSGKAVYLTGSHTWANLQDQGATDPPPVFDFDRYLDWLVERNHNFIRLWAWEQARWAPWSDGKNGTSDWFIQPSAYARTGPDLALDGKPQFDLTKFDPIYFTRLRERVKKAGDRGIYVSIMLFQGWSSAKGWLGGKPWSGHP